MGGRIMKEFVALELKMQMQTEISKMMMWQEGKEHITLKNKILRTQRRFESELHSVFTKKFNNIALSDSDDKRPQTHDGVTTYPYGYGCEQNL